MPAAPPVEEGYRPLSKRVIIAVIGLGVFGLLGFLLLAWRPAIPRIDPPAPTSFPAELIAGGQILAGAGFCVVCHTKPGGEPFAGGYGLETPFGTIYSTNITPDPATGIGGWSEAAFARAMHEGVARDGSHLFPVFPYDHFTKLSDDDVKALYAYFITRSPVSASTPPNTIPFPLNVRVFQEGWKLLFFRSGRYQPDTSKTAEWNRGAYLAGGLSHCGGCHTPRNGLGAEKVHDAYAGSVIDGWIAPALTDANPSPVPWTRSELFSYLRTGASPLHGVSAGPMSPVIHMGLGAVPDADVQAQAVYFADVDRSAARAPAVPAAVKTGLATSHFGSGQEYDPDARLYAAACMACHYNAGPVPRSVRPELALNSALTLPTPANFIRVVLGGLSLEDGGPGLVMPGYASAFTDGDVARLALYLRRTRTDRPPWADVDKQVAAIREQLAGPR
jgi:mono/diheme cytochrome c family protein